MAIPPANKRIVLMQLFIYIFCVFKSLVYETHNVYMTEH